MSSVVGRVPPATKRTGQARTHTVPTAAAFRARYRPFFFTLPARRVLCGNIALGVGADCVVDCSEGGCLSRGFCWGWPRRRGWRVKARGGIGSASARSLARAGAASVRHRRHRRGRLCSLEMAVAAAVFGTAWTAWMVRGNGAPWFKWNAPATRTGRSIRQRSTVPKQCSAVQCSAVQCSSSVS